MEFIKLMKTILNKIDSINPKAVNIKSLDAIIEKIIEQNSSEKVFPRNFKFSIAEKSFYNTPQQKNQK
jgi:hypothetical protein